MRFLDFFKKSEAAPAAKKNFQFMPLSELFDSIGFDNGGIPLPTGARFLNEGYLKNPVVYKAVKEISDCFAHLTFESVTISQDGDEQVITDTKDPLMSFVRNPSSAESHYKFLKRLAMSYSIFGVAYVFSPAADKETKPPSKPSLTYRILDPTRVSYSQETYPNGMPKFYQYKEADDKIFKCAIDMITGHSAILKISNPHPTSLLGAVSALSPAMAGIMTMNKGSEFNFSLVDKSARPSGLLKTENTLSEIEYSRMLEHVKKFFSGTSNAGTVPILEGGIEWQQTSLSPVDMAFDQLTNKQIMFIAQCLGVPLPLVLPETATYSNQRDARIAFYEDTILPMADFLLEEISSWFHHMGVPINQSLRVNEDRISALAYRREQAFTRMGKAVAEGIITINEARQELGFTPVDQGDELFIPSGHIPITALDFTEPQINDVQDPEGKGSEVY